VAATGTESCAEPVVSHKILITLREESRVRTM
jgi:hypothetical protein